MPGWTSVTYEKLAQSIDHSLLRPELTRPELTEGGGRPGDRKGDPENAYLTDEEKVRGCRLAEEAGAHYVKTSTGFAPGGVTLEDLRALTTGMQFHPPRS